MNDDGVEVEAYSHEEMRNLGPFYCLCAGIFKLVVFGEMVDEDLTEQFLCFLIRTSDDGVGAEE